MSNLKVVYNGTDITSTIPINGIEVDTSHSMAGESLEVDSVILESVGSEGYSAVTRLNDSTANPLNDVNAVELYALDGVQTVNRLNFVSQAPVDVTYKGNSVGKFYARETKLKNKRNTQLVAYSAIWLLKLKAAFPKFWASDTPVGDYLETLLSDVPHIVDPDVGDTLVSGLLVGNTAYDQLFELLFVSGAGCYTEPDGSLRIRYPEVSTTSVINKDRLVIGADVENQNPATYVQLTYYDYYESDAPIHEIYNGTPGAGIRTIYFDEPHPLSPISLSGASLLEHDYTYIKILVPSDASVVSFLANDYNRVLSYATAGQSTGTSADNAKIISGHTLVNSLNAGQILTRLNNYYSVAQKIKGTIICNSEKVGDVVSIYNPYSKQNVTATIYKMRYAFGLNEYRAEIEALIGFVPTQGGASYTHSIVLTGSGTITMAQLGNPQRIFVLGVGGGQGGTNGGNGGDSVMTYPSPQGWSANTPGMPGGVAGAKGIGGKVATRVIENPAVSYSYSCGAGGAVGGGAGGETFFGDILNTSNGIHKSNGTTRNNIIFGRDGNDGIAGGAGGYSGGYDSNLKRSIDGFPGGNAGGYVGGNPTYVHDYAGRPADYHSTVIIKCGGSGGGGASAENYGGNATPDYIYPSPGILGHVRLWDVPGQGAGCSDKGAAIGYGTGGDGGNGGGGAGGWSGWTCFNTITLTYSSFTLSVPGGRGGLGGAGAPGAILILY